jgi:hypothetical protein
MKWVGSIDRILVKSIYHLNDDEHELVLPVDCLRRAGR